MDWNLNYLMSDAIPIKVVDDLIAELSDEQDDMNHIIAHSIIALELLKARWERQKGEQK